MRDPRPLRSPEDGGPRKENELACAVLYADALGGLIGGKYPAIVEKIRRGEEHACGQFAELFAAGQPVNTSAKVRRLAFNAGYFAAVELLQFIETGEGVPTS